VKKSGGFLALLAAVTSLFIILSSCVMTVRPSPTTEIPEQFPGPPDLAVPNPGSILGSGNVAGANIEAGNLKIAANTYLADHKATLYLTSDDLVPSYLSAPARAKYYFSSTTGLITRVDSVSGGWAGIVFSLSEQKWIKGAPDNNHSDDQDIP